MDFFYSWQLVANKENDWFNFFDEQTIKNKIFSFFKTYFVF